MHFKTCFKRVFFKQYRLRFTCNVSSITLEHEKSLVSRSSLAFSNFSSLCKICLSKSFWQQVCCVTRISIRNEPIARDMMSNYTTLALTKFLCLFLCSFLLLLMLQKNLVTEENPVFDEWNTTDLFPLSNVLSSMSSNFEIQLISGHYFPNHKNRG